jgi:hypothetical protein
MHLPARSGICLDRARRATGGFPRRSAAHRRPRLVRPVLAGASAAEWMSRYLGKATETHAMPLRWEPVMLAWRGNPAVNDPGHSRSVPPHQRREALRRADDRTRAGSYGVRRSRPAASWPWQPVSAEADPACPRSPAGTRLRGP